MFSKALEKKIRRNGDFYIRKPAGFRQNQFCFLCNIKKITVDIHDIFFECLY